MTDKVKLGVIGLSPGNGHPYSWSAICNGFDMEYMRKCGFPVIPKYLDERKFPDEFISNAEVTHVWTQDQSLSRHIAKASRISNVVYDFEDMIGEVDGILLARDDSENHLFFSRPFLEAGMPIYVDKPLGLSVDGARRIIDLQSYSGQLFSCSALRYAHEMLLSPDEKEHLGAIKCIKGVTPKDWDKYSIHVIEPMLRSLAGHDVAIARKFRRKSGDCVTLNGQFNSGTLFEIKTMGQCDIPISLLVCGENKICEMIFTDTFSAFRGALQAFIDLTCKRIVAISADEMLASVSFVEAGRS